MPRTHLRLRQGGLRPGGLPEAGDPEGRGSHPVLRRRHSAGKDSGAQSRNSGLRKNLLLTAGRWLV